MGIGLSLTRSWWSPNVILPPYPKHFPTSKSVSQKNSDDPSEIKDGRSGSSSSRENSYTGNGHNLDDDTSWECAKCTHINYTFGSRCGSCRGLKGDKRDIIVKDR